MKTTLQPDAIVGVLLKGQPLIGRLLSLKGSKAVVSFGGQRRDQDLPLRDLNPTGVPGDGPDRLALPTPEAVQAVTIGVRTAAEAWWLLVSEAGDGGIVPCLSLAELTDLLLGFRGLADLAAVWTWLHSDQVWFRFRRDHTVQPRAVDDIRRQRQQSHRQRLLAADNRRQLDLVLEPLPLTHERRLTLNPAWIERLDRLVALADADAAEFSDGETSELLKQFGIPPERRALRQWLITRQLLNPHEPSALRGSVWSAHFSDALEQEASRLIERSQQPCIGDDQRLDFTDQIVYTLDDAATREIDDGLALVRDEAGLWIWVHIADPCRLIAPGSPLDREAQRRATSLYLADGVLPMLPLTLASDVLSLRAGQRCPALSVGIRLGPEGEVADSRCHRSWVRPKYRLTYEDGDELIELAPPGDEDLAELASLLKQRLRWRLSRGAIGFDRPEGRFRSSVDGPEVQVIEPSAARLMVSEAMLLMGAVVAEIGRREQLVLPFRSQPPSELPTQQELNAVPEGPARDAAIKRCLNRGVQGTRPMPHFSLGLDAYVQATSPIRRYADLLAHRQLIHWMEGSPALDEPEISAQLDSLEAPLRQSVQISREDQRHWQQVWLQQHRERTWTVQFLRWLRPQDQLALVHVPDLAVDVVGQAQGVEPRPGDLLQMQVEHVDPDQGELQLRFR